MRVTSGSWVILRAQVRLRVIDHSGPALHVTADVIDHNGPMSGHANPVIDHYALSGALGRNDL
jgi:hypothetical protein